MNAENDRVIPYIGVCDVPSHDVIVALRKHFRAYEPLYLKAGVTMSRRVLWGIPSKWKHVCPRRSMIAKIFAQNDPRVLNVIHYADYDGVDLLVSLERLAALAGPNLHGIQLDMVWPSPTTLEEFRKKHPTLFFILQVGTKALGQVGYHPLRLWEAMRSYDGVVDRILLDKSGGEGRPLVARELVRFVDIIYERMPSGVLGVAGGLGPETLQFVEPLLAMYPHLSIDAQSKLHEGGKALEGPFARSLAEGYVVRGLAMYRKYNALG